MIFLDTGFRRYDVGGGFSTFCEGINYAKASSYQSFPEWRKNQKKAEAAVAALQ